ncbi:TonB-dependent Receptor Plug Domain protein [compost metagenome]
MTLKNRVSSVVFLLFCLLSFTVSAQTVKIKGVVTSADGRGIPGVSVVVKDTGKGTSTNEKGEYEISVQKGKLLEFKSLGFKTQLLGVANSTTMDVIMVDDVNAMDEVIVVGYGTQKKSAITGAVSKLVNTNLDEIPTARLDNALIGKIAGLSVQNVSSEAGADPVLRVRGFSSISANSSPLVVVDGYPVPDGLSFVNPQDVESVEVLKDAASAAIYGSRAANGVILITTKSGAPDKPRYSVKTYYGVHDAYQLYPLYTFSEYADKLYREAALRGNDPSVPTNRKNLIMDTEIASYIIENQISGKATDWQNLALRNTASIYNVQLGISGGNKDLKYYISGNMQKDEGIMNYSENDRMSIKAKIDGTLSKKAKFSINFNPSYVGNVRPAANFTDYFRFPSFLPAYHTEFTAAFVRQNPQWANVLPGDYAEARHFNQLIYSGTLPDGTSYTGTAPVSPFSTQNNTPLSIASRVDINRKVYRLLGGTDFSYQFTPKLTFKTSLGGYYTKQEDNNFVKRNARQDGGVNEATVATRDFKDLLWENTLNYTNKKGNHNFTGLLGYTVQQTWVDNSTIVARDFPTDNFQTLNQAAQIDQNLTRTLKDKIGLISYLGRLTYDYKNKYLFAASFRTDGSSYFAEGNRWGVFPSVSAGWLVSSEKFMANVNWISNLKIRTSYGATGNNRISSFAFQDLLYPANYVFGAGTGTVNLGLSPNGSLLANPNITWERTFESNTGLDLGFLKNRFSLTLEYYDSTTDKLLYNQAAQSFTGSNEFINNAGKVRNRGIEIEFNSVNLKTKDFSWSSALTFSANRNKLLALGGEPFQYNFGERNEIYAAIVGQPAIQFFGYKTDGVWVSDAQIAAAKATGQTTTLSRYFQAGGLKFVDINGDNAIDANDRTVIGSPFPDFLWGINNTLKYKGFDLNILVQGSQGGQIVNGDPNYVEHRRYNKDFNSENRWLSEMYPGDGKTPYYTNGENWLLTDYVVEDASYLSVRTVILGYTMSSKAAKKVGVNSLRFYSSANNLFYLMGKSYRGINPEARMTSSAYASPLVDGYQRGSFPLLRTFTFGIDINF